MPAHSPTLEGKVRRIYGNRIRTECGERGITAQMCKEHVMTQNSAWKRAAREYMKQNPGVTFHEAMREVKRLHDEQREAMDIWDPFDDVLTIQEILKSAVTGEDQLLGVELSIDHTGGAFDVYLGPEIEEGPVTVTNVEIDPNSVSYDVHEEFDGGVTTGEVRVSASITYDACVFKATNYGAPETVSWYVTDHDWNDHYVRVEGEFTGELVYHFTIIEGENRTDGLDLVELIQLDNGGDNRQFGAARA